MMWWILGYYLAAAATLAWVCGRLRGDQPVSILGVALVSLLWPFFWTALLVMRALRKVGIVREVA